MKFNQLAEDIFTVEEFFTVKECLDTIVLSETQGYELAKINTAGGSRVRTDVRNNSRAFYNNEELAEKLWLRVQPFVPAHFGRSAAIGLNELFRFYRYQRGHRFRGHYDESYIRNEVEASYFTFIVYLNDNFGGGDTTFRGLRVQPRQGTALVFRHNLYHEGSEVTEGVKYVLRSDVMYRTEPAA